MDPTSRAKIPTQWGVFEMITYGSSLDDPMPHLALIHHKTGGSENILTRIHSECLTGDLFGSLRCECGSQLRQSLVQIGEQGGILIYLRQEGRGIGLIEKLKAYQLQDTGLNTVDANIHLGHDPDERTYDLAVRILENLGIRSIRLLTNNPQKIKAIEDSEIELTERIPIIIKSSHNNLRYLETKKKILGHLLD